MKELAIIQKTYDLIKWYVPILNRLPRDHKFNLGDRMVSSLYTLLEEFLTAQYSRQKLSRLESLNIRLTTLRYQTRLLSDFGLMKEKRYHYALKSINGIGGDLGNWIKQQRQKELSQT